MRFRPRHAALLLSLLVVACAPGPDAPAPTPTASVSARPSPDPIFDRLMAFAKREKLSERPLGEIMQALGELGLQSLEKGALHRLARLYWYTVEFGLAREDGQLKIYGAGLAQFARTAGIPESEAKTFLADTSEYSAMARQLARELVEELGGALGVGGAGDVFVGDDAFGGVAGAGRGDEVIVGVAEQVDQADGGSGSGGGVGRGRWNG